MKFSPKFEGMASFVAPANNPQKFSRRKSFFHLFVNVFSHESSHYTVLLFLSECNILNTALIYIHSLFKCITTIVHALPSCPFPHLPHLHPPLSLSSDLTTALPHFCLLPLSFSLELPPSFPPFTVPPFFPPLPNLQSLPPSSLLPFTLSPYPTIYSNIIFMSLLV